MYHANTNQCFADAEHDIVVFFLQKNKYSTKVQHPFSRVVMFSRQFLHMKYNCVCYWALSV